jgi:hypothetical protein
LAAAWTRESEGVWNEAWARVSERSKTQIDEGRPTQTNITDSANQRGKQSTMAEQLILVNAQNHAVGHAEKWSVHKAGRLHRAF